MFKDGDLVIPKVISDPYGYYIYKIIKKQNTFEFRIHDNQFRNTKFRLSIGKCVGESSPEMIGNLFELYKNLQNRELDSLNKVTIPTCKCGGKKLGYKDYSRMHYDWCELYKE